MSSALGGILSYLRRLSPDGVGDDDGPLLSRFVQGDVAAFTTLVGRHAPLVWGVCRRLLGPSHDAEDAFQATFVVLVEKAASLADGRPLGPWLHAVASRTATKARARAAKRRARETSAEAEPVTCEESAASRREVGAIVEEEVGRLPEHYRRAVVLCYMEGMTNEEAARRLECATGTIQSRLSRARDQLRDRLARRGLDPGSAVLPAVLAAEAAPRALVEAVVQAGPLLRAGAATGLSSSVVTLAKGVVIGMFLRKVEMAGVAMLAMALMAGGAGWLSQRPGDGAGVARAADEKGLAKKADDKAGKADAKTEKANADVSPSSAIADRVRKVIDFAGFDDPKTAFIEALDMLSKSHGITFEINEKAIKAEAPGIDVLSSRIAEQPIPPMKTSFHNVLNKVLSRITVPSGLTYLIRKGHVEITTWQAACIELGLPNAGTPMLVPPVLVHQDFRQTDLGEALTKIMEDTDVNIVFDPRSDTKTGAKTLVTARLMNVPIDTALKLLANMADLAVVKVDNVYYVTSPANAAKLQSAKPAAPMGGV